MSFSARAPRGMVATSQPDAARAGLAILREGGSAADAAIAMASCLTVVEPCSNGLGSDAFAIVWDPATSRLCGLNGSGRAPQALSADKLRARGLTEMPLRGWDPVTVPGAVSAWVALHKRFGRLEFGRLLADAVAHARDGYRVTPTVAAAWQASAARHRTYRGEEFAEWERVFAPNCRAPIATELWASPDHAATLESIAATGGESFYRGELAARIAAAGPWLTEADLARHTASWCQPISTTFHGYRVWELPPAGQGVAVLTALNILEALGVYEVFTPDAVHLAVEAVKLALTDAHAYVADPAAVAVPLEGLLSKGYARARAAEIGPRALDPAPGQPPGSDTVYLCAADEDGMMVSFIQSNFHGFGSHVVVPGTGIALQNRGHGFSLDPTHPNELAPGKRPFHTIIPGFVTSVDSHTPLGPFGVMGGHMQVQGHVQVLLDTILAGDGPQQALNRPRWFWESGRVVECESWLTAAELRARGHEARAATRSSFFGRGQIIWRDEFGYVGGSEPRCDGLVLGY